MYRMCLYVSVYGALLCSRLPGWVQSMIPRVFYITEKAWNYYPVTITGVNNDDMFKKLNGNVKPLSFLPLYGCGNGMPTIDTEYTVSYSAQCSACVYTLCILPPLSTEHAYMYSAHFYPSS